MASELRQRASSTGTALDKRKTELRQNIQAMEAQFQMAMPKGVEAKQLVRDAMTVMSANPGLAACEPASVLGALMTCAQLGLRPGVLGQAWVIPFKGKGTLIIGYQGLLSLAQRSGDIKSISARIVYSKDIFEYEYGLDDRLIHRPAAGERGEAIAYYCVVKSVRGGTYWEVLTKTDAELHRDKFAMARKNGAVVGPWAEHFDAMALKTVIMRVLKLAPRNTELQQVISADESVRVDLSPTADITASVVDIQQGSDDIPEAEIEDPPGWGEMDGAEALGEEAR